LIAHFTAVAEATLLPNILYNVPSRTITSLELDSIVKLSQHPRICGIKEASGNIDFAKQIRQACGKDFLLLSGDDGSYDGFMTAGGDGVISVSSHIIPQAMLKVNASKYQSLIDHLFIESNPMPVKKALHLMGLLRSPECRLPLVEMSALHAEKLQSLMKEQGLL
jgi:4-hydroxy-tetrahydrodipicolinate synthase